MIAFVGFSLKRAWQGFWRNALMSLAATASMVLMLTLLSGVIILWFGLNATSRGKSRSWPISTIRPPRRTSRSSPRP
jgi:cell division protein FtsX